MTDPLNLLSALPGLLIFRIGAKEFCMDVKYVQTILNVAGNEGNIRKVERATGIQGKIGHSDAEYFIIDTIKYFDTAPEKAKGKKIILCIVFGKRIGIIVDTIVEFISLDTLFIEKNIDFNVYQEDKYVSWYLDYQERKVLYPNYEMIAKELTSSGFFLSMPILSAAYYLMSLLMNYYNMIPISTL